MWELGVGCGVGEVRGMCDVGVELGAGVMKPNLPVTSM